MIELLKPHTHAGRYYPAGSVLDTGTVPMDPDSIEWLIAIGVARKIEEERGVPSRLTTSRTKAKPKGD